MDGAPQTPTHDVNAGEALAVPRYFTTPGVHPFDSVAWEIRDARIGFGGNVSFEQTGVEFPSTWSQNATNIVAQKYFRGKLDSPSRERSVKQMIGRVSGTIADWGRQRGYFASAEDGDAFEAELTYILLHQMAAFNSPVWFNVGFEESPQASACFILSVEDTMDSILDWNTREGRIFRGGSGSGVNLSNIRGSMEPLSKGGTASGPVSFMRGADAWAGTIKSGGKTRRAAKMVVLDVDHPDIREFIWCKAKEEDKARALAKAGFDMSLDGDGMISIQYQNANNSVRVTDEFMRAVEDGDEWRTTARATGEPIGEPIDARELMARSPTPRGAAPIPACSTTPPSTSGTRRRSPDVSMLPILASPRRHASTRRAASCASVSCTSVGRTARPASRSTRTARPQARTAPRRGPRAREWSPPRRCA